MGMSPQLFVAGASGYTGRHLVALARARGLPVIAHLRPGGGRSGERGALVQGWLDAGAEVVEAAWDAPTLRALLQQKGVTHAFGLLGITRAGAKAEGARTGQTPSYDSVDRDLTLLLHQACCAVEPPPRFVYLSSLGADAPGGNAYLRARAAVEAALRGGACPWTSVRPGFITGDDRDEARPAERIGARVTAAGLGLVGALGATRLRDRFAPVDGAELAGLLLDAALDPAAAGRVLDLADLRGR
jgi:NADH dehydrogenase